MVELQLKLALVYLDMKALFPFADVHGAIWFSEKKIGIEQSLDPHNNPTRRNRYHFTLAHEAGHWCLHRKQFLQTPGQKRLFEDGSAQPDVVCRSSESKRRVEWQADFFAACLLMPRTLIRVAWAQFRQGSDVPMTISELRQRNAMGDSSRKNEGSDKSGRDQEAVDVALKEDFCRDLAQQFQVSAEAMRIRLEHLGLLVNTKQMRLF
jgi:Zn-dependent peptidase ImmA (M78 family)